jgi:hypothetical protein
MRRYGKRGDMSLLVDMRCRNYLEIVGKGELWPESNFHTNFLSLI